MLGCFDIVNRQFGRATSALEGRFRISLKLIFSGRMLQFCIMLDPLRPGYINTAGRLSCRNRSGEVSQKCWHIAPYIIGALIAIAALTLLLVSISISLPDNEIRVMSFEPNGWTSSTTNMTIKFSKPMVPRTASTNRSQSTAGVLTTDSRLGDG